MKYMGDPMYNWSTKEMRQEWGMKASECIAYIDAIIKDWI